MRRIMGQYYGLVWCVWSYNEKRRGEKWRMKNKDSISCSEKKKGGRAEEEYQVRAEYTFPEIESYK